MKDVFFVWFKIYFLLSEKCFMTFEVDFAFAASFLQVLEGHTDEIFSCAFNYEGNIIITGNSVHSSSAVMCSGNVIFHLSVSSVSFLASLLFLGVVVTWEKTHLRFVRLLVLLAK